MEQRRESVNIRSIAKYAREAGFCPTNPIDTHESINQLIVFLKDRDRMDMVRALGMKTDKQKRNLIEHIIWK